VKDRASAENTFKLLPLSLLALRVSKHDAHEGHNHGKGKRVKGLWTVKIEQHQETDPMTHYVWLYEGPQWKQKAMAAAVVAGIFAVVLFPLWPIMLRQGVWYLSVGMMGLLGLFFAMSIFRLILFCVTVFVVPPGLWLFPNLFEDVGFFDSFKPVWGWQEVRADTPREPVGITDSVFRDVEKREEAQEIKESCGWNDLTPRWRGNRCCHIGTCHSHDDICHQYRGAIEASSHRQCRRRRRRLILRKVYLLEFCLLHSSCSSGTCHKCPSIRCPRRSVAALCAPNVCVHLSCNEGQWVSDSFIHNSVVIDKKKMFSQTKCTMGGMENCVSKTGLMAERIHGRR
jgi:protein translocation Sec62 family protein